MKNHLSILVVEDDELARLSLVNRLKSIGPVAQANNAKEARILMEMKKFDVAFLDLDLEVDLIGLELVKEALARNIHPIVLSGREEEEIITLAYENGCSDFLSKPFTKESIDFVLRKIELSSTKNANLQKLEEFFLTTDNSLKQQLTVIEQAIHSSQPLLITGETGTGKTFLAKYVHQLVDESKPFVHLNCAEVTESLMESELFGHEKGAFTGALKSKKGLLELADGGTLFLDEIATLSTSMQKKLLKAIEEKVFYPVGSEKPIKSHFRLISATCEDLSAKIVNGDFRQDFYFRIEGFNVHLKSLRERKQDILSIANYFLKRGERKIILSPEVKDIFKNYGWPGNVREMERVIEILRTRSTGLIKIQDLNGLLTSTHRSQKNTKDIDLNLVKSMGLNAYIEMIENKILEQVLAENSDRVRKTMADLKLSNNSFYRIMTNLKARVENVGG